MTRMDHLFKMQKHRVNFIKIIIENQSFICNIEKKGEEYDID